MNGGYLMVSKADTNLYEKLNKALTLGKPVLWYEDENICYYIDTITKSGTDIILTKGGKTITIENDGNITEVGDVLNALMENIKDLNGHLRFIEGNGIASDELDAGLEIGFFKWSLSGTHIMLVLVADIASGSTLSNNKYWGKFELPEWIYNKIIPVTGGTVIEYKGAGARSSGGSIVLNDTFYISKSGNNSISIYRTGNTTATTADATIRVQFDLLIDNE